MIIDRHSHGCSTISNNGKTFLVVIGGWSEELGTSLDSTEMLDISDSNAGWIEGISLIHLWLMAYFIIFMKDIQNIPYNFLF